MEPADAPKGPLEKVSAEEFLGLRRVASYEGVESLLELQGERGAPGDGKAAATGSLLRPAASRDDEPPPREHTPPMLTGGVYSHSNTPPGLSNCASEESSDSFVGVRMPDAAGPRATAPSPLRPPPSGPADMSRSSSEDSGHSVHSAGGSGNAGIIHGAPPLPPWLPAHVALAGDLPSKTATRDYPASRIGADRKEWLAEDDSLIRGAVEVHTLTTPPHTPLCAHTPRRAAPPPPTHATNSSRPPPPTPPPPPAPPPWARAGPRVQVA